MIEQLTTAHYKKMRWKNGAGYTVELARSEGESLDVFDWRISMADVKSAGEFSKFHGMQRILTVLDGQGIVLNVDDDHRHLKTLQSAQFSGERDVSCELPHGQIQDFNLIYDPQKVNARYQWISEPTTSEIFSSADLIFIFNQSLELLEIEIDQQVFHLKHQESLKIQYEKLLKFIVLRESLLKQTCLIELTKI
ncbi:HutD family protein [Acinetobacter sp. 2JN-4]|uniref:HutD/Ves family protein n=1 Tax=Acinetobacter sp. 2JN-4 TaxID=2479844 RepID=UPI000EF98D14|nr:HutD family protein [Acinetobacter sp. 2JN-4]RLZ08226.1 HutD family protein [Acinetobacter sp. 2JN-4]